MNNGLLIIYLKYKTKKSQRRQDKEGVKFMEIILCKQFILSIIDTWWTLLKYILEKIPESDYPSRAYYTNAQQN